MSSAGRCIACSTASGILVGPGIARNSRPARTTMLLLPFVARWATRHPESHINAPPGRGARPGYGVEAVLYAGGDQEKSRLSPGLAAAGGFGVIDRTEPPRALGHVHLDLGVPAAGRL